MIQITSNFWVCVQVLYTFSSSIDSEGPFKPLYKEVISEFTGWVNFVLEDGTIDQIKKVIRFAPICPSYFQFRPFFSFMVDDMFFFRQVSLLKCLQTLDVN